MAELVPLDVMLLSQLMQVTLSVVLLVAILGLVRLFHHEAIATLARGWACFLMLLVFSLFYVMTFKTRQPWLWQATAAAAQDITVVAMWWLWRPVAGKLSGRPEERSQRRDRTWQLVVGLGAITWDILDALKVPWIPPNVLDHVFAAAFLWLAWITWRESRIATRNAGILRWLAFGFLLFTFRAEASILLLPTEGFNTARFSQLALVAGLQMAQVASFGAICLVVSLSLEQLAILEQSERLRNAESRLFKAHHLASLGDLAARVAHDFGNVLQGISTGVELAREDLPAPAPAVKSLDLVARQAERGKALVSQLLGYARAGAAPAGRCVLDEHLVLNGDSIAHLAGDGVTVRISTASPGAAVPLDPTSLDRMLMNLVANARDASPPGGEIRIESALEATALPKRGETRAEAPGEWVRLRVTDAGAGIPPEVREKIFEPFFSTKGSQGTGLGLATVAAIVAHAGGDITVTSEAGGGTCFEVRLPRVPALHP